MTEGQLKNIVQFSRTQGYITALLDVVTMIDTKITEYADPSVDEALIELSQALFKIASDDEKKLKADIEAFETALRKEVEAEEK